MKALALAITLAIIPVVSAAKDTPAQVKKCLTAHPEVAISRLQKPPYSRVDFRGTQREYIVAVREKTGLRRALAMICSQDGSVVLGGAGQPRFSDMLHDSYMASDWRVCRKPQIQELRQYYPNVPTVQNEAVCLTWEDGEAMIYWDGQAFKFFSFHP